MGVEGCPRRPRGSWELSLLLFEQGLQLLNLLLYVGELLLSSVLRVANCSESRGVGVVLGRVFLVLLERLLESLLDRSAARRGPGSPSPSSTAEFTRSPSSRDFTFSSTAEGLPPMTTRDSPALHTCAALKLRLCL